MKQKMLLYAAGMMVIFLGGCAGNDSQTDRQNSEIIQNQSSLETDSQTVESITAASEKSDCYIGEEEAKRAALKHAGLEDGQVTFVSAVLELEDGQWEYEVEFYTADYKEYDYEINAVTGEVIAFSYDAKSYRPQSAGLETITAEQAQQIALAQVRGAEQSDIREFESDYDDGRLQYEGKLIYDGMEYEFEIDADGGVIREWSVEPFGR